MNDVTVTVELPKNDAVPERPFRYKLEGAYLNAGASGAAPAAIERADMLARLPITARPIYGARALVEDLFPPGMKENAREAMWARLRKTWREAGHTVEKDRTIRRK